MSETLTRPSRSESAACAAELRAEGLTGQEIADRMGISRAYAYDLLNDPDGSLAKARKLQYAATCEDCGARDSGSDGHRDEWVCGDCLHEREFGERNRAIRELWQHGVPGPEIATRLGISHNSVLSFIDSERRERGKPLARRHRERRELWPEIERRWRAGESGIDIARALNTTHSAGFDLPARPSQRDEEQWALIERLWRDGAKLREIADELGVALGTASTKVAYMRRAGADLPYRYRRRDAA